MGKLICLLGKSATGKSTIEKLLETKGLDRVVSYTTRPMRNGERHGSDYWFVDDIDFEIFLKVDQLIEHTVYREWQYGIHENTVDLSLGSYVAVVEPHGYRQIIKKLGKENVIGIYITINDKERLLRSLHREENPDCREICRRFISDIELFDGIEKEVDLIVENEYINLTVEQIMNFINERGKL